MEIRIGKSAKTCETCNREFVHEEKLHSVARFAEGALIREDFCAACWIPDHAKAAFSAWATKFTDPRVAEQQPPEVYSPLRKLFYDLSLSEDRSSQATAYLAAQMLRRMKAFRLVKESDESDGEVRVTLFADRIGNRLIEVRDPSFSFAELDGARLALFKCLRETDEGGAESAAPETPEAVPPENSEPVGEDVTNTGEPSCQT